MKFKLFIMTSIYAISLRIVHAAQIEYKQKEAEQLEESLDIGNTKIYKLKLENGQSLNFEKRLLDQSKFFQTFLKWHKQVIEIPVPFNIPSSETGFIENISLQDLHDILRIIADNKKNAIQGLRKFLLEDGPSLQRLMQLLHVAIYFGIRPLEKIIIIKLGAMFANERNKAVDEAVAELPEVLQIEIARLAAAQNKLLQGFLLKNYTPIRVVSTRNVRSISWSPDGEQLALGIESGSHAGTVEIWNKKTNAIRILQMPYPLDQVESIAWSPNGKQLAFGTLAGGLLSGILGVYDLETGILRTLLQDQDWITSVSWSPDDNLLAASTHNGIIRIFDRNTWTERILTEVTGKIKSVAWSPDSKQIAVGSSDGIFIMDAYTGIIINTLKRDKKSVPFSFNTVAWAPNGKLIASKGVGYVDIWDVKKGKSAQSLIADFRSGAIAWSPDSQAIAFTSSNGVIQIWDIRARKVLSEFITTAFQSYLNKIKILIHSIAWSPDLKMLATAGKYVELWDVANQNLLDLTINQVKLVERIIRTQQIEIANEERQAYWSLPQGWRRILFQAFGKRAAEQKSNCIVS